VSVLLALVFGVFIGSLLVYAVVFSDYIKNKKNETQITDNEVQYLLDQMSPRDFYIHKMSQTTLKWDSKTNTYVKKWSDSDRT
tara:strand:+ start:202 stop:450 length:249 start_codon:yes stop_codon:yes gene_type:complete